MVNRAVFTTLLCLASMLLSASAWAQVPASLVGTWSAKWQTDNREYDATLTVTESGGTWQTLTRNRTNACAGREVPMKLESSTASGAEFTLMFSEVLPGCPNAKVALSVGTDGKVSGIRSRFPLSLVKK